MKTEQWYAYSTPEGSINLIEGDKMPVEPIKPPDEIPTHAGMLCIGGDVFGYEKAMKKYEASLQRAKEQAVPVDDSVKWLKAVGLTGDLQPDTIYGPFSLRYEIKGVCCSPISPNIIHQGCCDTCDRYTEVAILHDTPEKKITKVKCNCSCHRNPGVKHVVECCDNGWIEVEVPEKEETQEQIFDDMFCKYFDYRYEKGMSGYHACLEIQKEFTITRK